MAIYSGLRRVACCWLRSGAQPLYWWMRRGMRLDQETLADAAAAEVAGRQAYAEQLVAWARDVVARPQPLLPASVGLWEGASQLRRRVAVLVDERFTTLRECSRQLRWASFFAFGAVAFVVSLVSFGPVRATNGISGGEAAPEREQQIEDSLTNYPHGNGPKGPVAVEGKCVDEEGSALAGVQVALFRRMFAERTTELLDRSTTNEAGKFRFAELEGPSRDEEHAMMYCILVWSAGRASSVGNMHPDYPRHVEFKMTPAAELSGRVVNEEGNAVQGGRCALSISCRLQWKVCATHEPTRTAIFL